MVSTPAKHNQADKTKNETKPNGEHRQQDRTTRLVGVTSSPCAIGNAQWYEEAFEELKTVSNIDDLDRLVAVFIKQEDEHFSLFNYIQTVNQETDQHLEKTEELEVC